MSIEELVLPFVTVEKDLPEEGELASVICIAKSRQRKTGPFKQQYRDLEFASKLSYPIWAIPWDEKCFLIDGLRETIGSFFYPQSPDPETFIENLKRDSKVQNDYARTLKSQLSFFSEFISRKEISITGFMDNKELLSDMQNFMLENKANVKTLPLHSLSLLPSRITSDAAVAVSNSILEYYYKLHFEAKGLRIAEETLKTQTQFQVVKFQKEFGQIWQDSAQEIESLRKEVAGKKESLKNEHDARLQELTTALDGKMNLISRDKKRLETMLLKLEQNRAELEKRQKLRKEKNDKIGEVRWKVRLENIEHRISEVKGRIRPLSKQIAEMNDEFKRSEKKMQDSYRESTKKEDERVSDLEKLHNKRVSEKTRDMANLQLNTQTIIKKIENLIGELNVAFSRIENTTIDWKIENPLLIAIPFYAISFVTHEGRNISLLSPVMVQQNKGFAERIRSAMGASNLESKINNFLKPRSRSIDVFLHSFEKKLEDDLKLTEDLKKTGTESNLIVLPGFREKLKNGLEKLEAYEWISPREKETILNEFTIC